MSNSAKKRRTVFIKRGFQMRFITWVIGLLIMCCLCSAAVLYPFLSSELTSRITSGHHDVGSIKGHMALAILIGNVLAIIVASLATTIVIMYISHKIAGPLYRFEMICREIGQGNLGVSAGLRDRDQLVGLSEAFDEMITQLRNRRCNQYERLQEARKSLKSLQESISDSSADKEIVRSVDKLLTSLTDEMKENQSQN